MTKQKYKKKHRNARNIIKKNIKNKRVLILTSNCRKRKTAARLIHYKFYIFGR